MKVLVGVVGAISAAVGVEAVRRHLPPDWRIRRNVALNCLRGRPTLYRLRVVPQPLLSVADGTEGLLMAECIADGGYTGIKFGLEPS